jgi:hypothetical protein
MATETGTLNINLNVQQTIDIMLEPVFTDGLLSDSFQIVKNFYGGERTIGLLEAMKNVVGKQQPCSPKYKGTATMSERKLYANYLDAGAKMCYEEFMNTHYDLLAPLYSNQGTPDIRQLTSILTKLLGDAIRRDVERIAWFGNSASTDANINQADGIFKYINQLITTGEIGHREDSTQGTELTEQQAYELLLNVFFKAPAALRRLPRAERVIHINGDLWNKVLLYLHNNAVTNGFINVFEEPLGETVGTFQGVPVLVHETWDSVSEEYFGLEFQNKIIYTAKANFVMGTDLRPDAAGGMAKFKAYEDPKTDELFMYSKFVFAVNYVWPELISVGF